MNFAYNIFIEVYKTFLWASSLFNKKHRDIILGQQNLVKNIINDTKNTKDIVWFHVSSLGEFEQAKPIISAYKNKYANHRILMTVYSPSAYNNIKENSDVDWIFYLPHDTIKNAKKIISAVKPIKVIFVKYEFWYNYLSEITKNNIPLYYVCVRFRTEQYFFKTYGSWFIKKLQSVTHFFVQDESSKLLLNQAGIKQVTITGDSRFEMVKKNADTKYLNHKIERFINNRKIFIAGSIWEKDIEIISKIIDKIGYKFIIAPHETENIEYLKSLNQSICLSKDIHEGIEDFNILIIDNIGILNKLYRYADISYIGGGFGKGVHNILESATYNVPTIFGPNYLKSKEAIDLINLRCAKSIVNSSELLESIIYFENKDLKDKIKGYIDSNLGSVNTIIENI